MQQPTTGTHTHKYIKDTWPSYHSVSFSLLHHPHHPLAYGTSKSRQLLLFVSLWLTSSSPLLFTLSPLNTSGDLKWLNLSPLILWSCIPHLSCIECPTDWMQLLAWHKETRTHTLTHIHTANKHTATGCCKATRKIWTNDCVAIGSMLLLLARITRNCNRLFSLSLSLSLVLRWGFYLTEHRHTLELVGERSWKEALEPS